MVSKDDIYFFNNIIECRPLDYEPNPGGLGLILFNSMQLYKDQIAQIDCKTGKEETFDTLLKNSIRTAITLKSKGIKNDDIICICSHNQLYTPVPFISAQFLGIKTTFLDPNLLLKDMQYLLDQLINVKFIFISKQCQDLMKNIKNINAEIVILDDEFKRNFLKESIDENNFQPNHITSVHNTAVIIFSSGTSGLPKGICLSHFTLLSQMYTSQFIEDINKDFNRIKLEETRVSYPIKILSFTTMYWISSINFVIGSISYGLCRLICENFNPEEIWWLIDKYKPIYLFLLPYNAITMCRIGRPKDINLSHLLRLQIGGTPITKDQIEFIRKTLPDCDVYQSYGQTETAGGITTFNPLSYYHREMFMKKPDSCGLPLRGFSYKIINDNNNDKPLGPYQTGELLIKTNIKMKGYYNLTSNEVYDKTGWMKTGDIVYYDADFCFFIVDRIKEVLKFRGAAIIPAILENELLKYPNVIEAVVIGKIHEDGDCPLGLVVLDKKFKYDNNDLIAKDIEIFANKQLHKDNQLFGGVRIVESLPKGSNGKIKRKKLYNLINSK